MHLCGICYWSCSVGYFGDLDRYRFPVLGAEYIRPGLGVLVLDGTVTEDDCGRGSSCLSGSRRGPGLYASVCCLVGTASGLLSVNIEEGSMEDKVVVDVMDREGLGMIEGWVGRLGLTWWVERESACRDVADPGEVNDKSRG